MEGDGEAYSFRAGLDDVLSLAVDDAPLIDALSRSSLKRSGGVLGSILRDSNKPSSDGDHECIRVRNQ